MNLLQRGKKRNKRGPATAGWGLIPSRIDTTHRPAIVGAKSRLGDWELDSIIGAKYRGSTTSMVERETKLTILVLLDVPTSEATKEGIIRRLAPHKKYVLTLTSDNGKEFAGHVEISEKLGLAFYFCMPYHSLERGLNEKTKGLVRKCLPKGTDFAKLTAADLQRVENLLNNRTRKALNYHSPMRSSPSSQPRPKIMQLVCELRKQKNCRAFPPDYLDKSWCYFLYWDSELEVS